MHRIDPPWKCYLYHASGVIGISTIGERIKALRQSRAMTQAQLGNILGVQKAAVQKYESGSVRNIGSDKIKLLCKTFGVFPRYFVYEDDDEFHRDIFGKLFADGNRPRLTDGETVIKIMNGEIGQHMLRIMTEISELNSDGFKRVSDYVSDVHGNERFRK